jgi:archaellum component FlaC
MPEQTTDEMKSDETLKQNPEPDPILQAIADLSRKFDSFEKGVNAQFEAIREGIAYNSAKFDRIEAKIFDARSDISNLRADIKEMSERMRQRSGEIV